ncbi:retrovirus-related pol polyprotein from transposon TNT 1-94, partial [Tanacetum coccineum]
MHNNIMAAGSRDHPPMLAMGQYAQWRSRFLRYIDTSPNGDALRKCILQGPYTPTNVVVLAVPATENSLAVPEQTTVETVMNMTPENRAHFESEKEAIHLILTGIGDEIYSTVDAYVKTNLFWEFGQFTSHDGETIESYYTRFYKMMNEMIRNNLIVATMQVNVQFLQQLQPEWSRFVTIVKQQHKLDEVSYHKLFDILKQYQKEVNELRAERMAKNANPLALVATAHTLQDTYYQSSKPQKLYAPASKASLPTGSHATTRYKDMQKNLALIAKYFKKIYKPTNNNLRTSSNTRNKNVDTTPRYKNDNQTGQFGNQRAVNVVGARETVGGPVVQQSGIQCFNCKEFGHYAKECRKPKWVKDSTYHKEKMLLCKQAEKDSGTDSEPLEQVQYDTDDNVSANDIQHFEQSESISNTCVVEDKRVIDNVIPDHRIDLKYVESLEDEIDELESDKAEFSNMYDMLLQECVSNDIMCSYLQSSSDLDEITELQTFYSSKSQGMWTVLHKAFGKQTDFVKQLKNDTVCKEKASNVFRKEREQYFEIQDLKAQLQDKNIAIRKPTPFSDSLERTNFAKKKSVSKTNESEGLSKPVTLQNLPQTATQAVRNTNVIKPGMYQITSSTTQTRAPQLTQTSRNTNPHVSTSTGVAHRTNVSRPQPRSNQMKYKVLPNTSQVKFKKTKVEDHPRISCISKQTKSETACNDSLNSRTSNVNAVCATCGKCVFNLNHDACVCKFLNNVNARTKNPNVVPISTRKPKSQANKSVANPIENVALIVQLILFIVDLGSTKHITGNLSLLCNFVEKYLGTVRFGTDQIALILGYGDLVQGNIMINRVYYVEGLNHSLFSVGQFCDVDLEVAFRKSTCFVRDLQGNNLLTVSKAKSSFKTKTVPSSKGRLNLLHMDLCGSMRVASINGKKYILVIVDDYSRYTWTLFLRSKDETPEVLKDFLKMIQRNLQALNGIVKRRNCTLIEAARMMLSASKLPLFFWAEAIATACYTQNRSIIIPTYEKTAYHIINDRKPSIKHLHIFGCTCYLTRDGENLDKMKEKGDLCILVGYSTQSKGYRVYNKRIRLIVESIHLRFDEIKEMSETSVANDGLIPQRQKASDYDNSDPVLQLQNVSSSADTSIPSQQELDLLFGPLYDEFFNTEPSTLKNDHAEENNVNQAEDAQFQQDEFTNPFCTSVREVAESSSHNIGNSNLDTFNQPQDSEYRWTKDHPLTQVYGNPSRPVQTRRQLATDLEMCMFTLTVSTAEPKNIKEAMADSAWIEAMHEELHQFDKLQVWE